MQNNARQRSTLQFFAPSIYAAHSERARINPRLRPRLRPLAVIIRRNRDPPIAGAPATVLTTANSIFAKLRLAPGRNAVANRRLALFVAAEIDSHRYKGGPDARSIRKLRPQERPRSAAKFWRSPAMKNCPIRARATCISNFSSHRIKRYAGAKIIFRYDIVPIARIIKIQLYYISKDLVSGA